MAVFLESDEGKPPNQTVQPTPISAGTTPRWIYDPEWSVDQEMELRAGIIIDTYERELLDAARIIADYHIPYYVTIMNVAAPIAEDDDIRVSIYDTEEKALLDPIINDEEAMRFFEHFLARSNSPYAKENFRIYAITVSEHTYSFAVSDNELGNYSIFYIVESHPSQVQGPHFRENWTIFRLVI